MSRRWTLSRWAFVALLLVAWAIRLAAANGSSSLHPDEALYAYWGRLIGSGRDPWLANVPVYKPPLLPYLISGAQLAFGDRALGLRMPALAAGMLMVPLTAALARSLYRDRWLVLPSGIMIALSPFAVQFAATVFPDPVMVVLGLAAAVAAARSRPLLAGVLAGLAFSTKQTGLIWSPLAFALLIGQARRGVRRQAVLYLAAFALPLVLVAGWDGARTLLGAEGFWSEAVRGYGGLRTIWPHEMDARAIGWAQIARHMLASPVLNGLMLVSVGMVIAQALTRGRRKRDSLFDLILVGFVAVYFLMHFVLAFPVWDRYMLVLVPILAVLFSRGARIAVGRCGRSAAVSRLQVRWCKHPVSRKVDWPQVLVGGGIAALLAIGAYGPSGVQARVGGDLGASAGIDQVSRHVAAQPDGSVLYHHWQGWHHAYYLFDDLIYLAFWPDPSWLADDVRAFASGEPRYIAFPAGESRARVDHALARQGYRLGQVLAARSDDGTPTFTLYRLVPASQS